MRIDLCANFDGYSVRLVDETSDEVLATFRTFDEAAISYRATKQASHDALGMLAACLSNTETKGA
jgi:hypothetical protein